MKVTLIIAQQISLRQDLHIFNTDNSIYNYLIYNLAQGMKEWLEHHSGHGVDHFYLINDDSTDDVGKILLPYITSGKVTMFPTSSRTAVYRQTGIYKRVFTEIYAKNESKWITIIDLDEYMYSPTHVRISDILRQHDDLSLIGVNWMWFGSSGYIKQPASIVQSFTKRAKVDMTQYPELLENYKVLRPSHTPEVRDVCLYRLAKL